ncbi:NAD(P)-dependent dehydrogenase (short-subunit alcohol dehydrogenase family) [Kribbella aluminosa]|uniref:NAD(P)-dependent dehydrogenase (Short-subunit alcohol dehydrogenase family) n=1 Tax=Kribbella aluminosa TaxID=416017 RepID=A0ABS4UTL6_9ACTN|nr:SDR family NAD(P)-dependent oxidoreductase [Kribbella aluminosa]MBP2354961.1 NAD(P)-dependent dehydrogenase (short-subunit alcohol dehydrogenase family) [Kribbella aluminosa]
MPDQQRVALVTGANRGLGREIARQLAARRIHVVLTARNHAAAEEAAAEIRGDGLAVSSTRLDVTDPGSITAAIAELRRLDILVNNAGVTDGDHRAATIPASEVRRVLEVNLLGAWRCASAAIPLMRDQRYGRIVNVSSRLASLSTMTSGTEPAYRVSKAALNALTRVLAADVAGAGVLVNSCSPGWVRTELGGPNAPTTVEEGAATPVWLATLPDGGPTGQFFAGHTPAPW